MPLREYFLLIPKSIFIFVFPLLAHFTALPLIHRYRGPPSPPGEGFFYIHPRKIYHMLTFNESPLLIKSNYIIYYSGGQGGIGGYSIYFRRYR
jgi:hypothetical protein